MSRTAKRFVVVDLGTQVDSQRRFAVWDATVSRFWKINNHQTWAYVDDLIADFAARFPVDGKSAPVHLDQRDVIAEQAFVLGFDRDVE